MCVALQSQVLFSGVVAGMGVGAVGVDGAVVVQLNQFVPKCPIGVFRKYSLCRSIVKLRKNDD